MGADRYTTCPRCEHEYEDAHGKLVDEITRDFGDLSAAARQALLPVLAAERGLERPDQTFREDYEFAHGDNDPTVQIVYKGHCSVCDLTFKLDETYTIWEPGQ